MTTPNEDEISGHNDLQSARLERAAPALRQDVAAMLGGAERLANNKTIRDAYLQSGIPAGVTASAISTVLGMVAGRIMRLSGGDSMLAKKRALSVLEAACDRHRTGFIGKGYLFRLAPEFYTTCWKEADADEIDTYARILRAMTMEVCDLLKDDANGVSCVRSLMHTSIDFLATMGA